MKHLRDDSLEPSQSFEYSWPNKRTKTQNLIELKFEHHQQSANSAGDSATEAVDASSISD